MSKPTIGFIGLGLMGGAMVGRLQDQGYDLTVIANRTRTYVDQAVARGATEVTTAKAVAEASDIVMLCMDTSASVESRMHGAEGVIAGLRPGAVAIATIGSRSEFIACVSRCLLSWRSVDSAACRTTP